MRTWPAARRTTCASLSKGRASPPSTRSRAPRAPRGSSQTRSVAPPAGSESARSSTVAPSTSIRLRALTGASEKFATLAKSCTRSGARAKGRATRRVIATLATAPPIRSHRSAAGSAASASRSGGAAKTPAERSTIRFSRPAASERMRIRSECSPPLPGLRSWILSSSRAELTLKTIASPAAAWNL